MFQCALDGRAAVDCAFPMIQHAENHLRMIRSWPTDPAHCVSPSTISSAGCCASAMKIVPDAVTSVQLLAIDRLASVHHHSLPAPTIAPLRPLKICSDWNLDPVRLDYRRAALWWPTSSVSVANATMTFCTSLGLDWPERFWPNRVSWTSCPKYSM